MPNTWLIVANSTHADLYNASLNVNGGDLELLQTMDHPEGRSKSADLISDKSGNFHARHESGSAYAPAKSPKKIECERFAHQIASMLESGRTHNNYRNLIVVAPANFLGILREFLPMHVQNKVVIAIEKDYTRLENRDLATKVYQYIYCH